jgi:tRNA (Thr-GGU) A37 N-methylase
MPENKVENRVELVADSMQENPCKMSTQVISVSDIINKYFSGFNGIDNFSYFVILFYFISFFNLYLLILLL